MADKQTETTKPTESKSDKFKRMVEMRTGKALSAIAVIGNLANKNTYEYTETQVDKVIAALNAEVTVLTNRFKKPNSVKSSGFSLD